MTKIAIVGAQAGDEGKAKVTSYLNKRGVATAPRQATPLFYKNPSGIYLPVKANLVTRYQGANNAGHTVLEDGIEHKFHHLPSGIPFENTFSLMDFGMLCNPRDMVQEIRKYAERGTAITPEILGMDSKIHMILDYHVEEDQASFNIAGGNHTSTGKGIKQAARDKYFRVGLRFVEFLNPDVMKEVLKQKKFPDGKVPKNGGHVSIDEFVDSYAEEREALKQFLVQGYKMRQVHGQHLSIEEGAQALRLDIDLGQYPGITSSNPAITPYPVDHKVGVIKLYESSVGVGDRAFVGEMSAALQDKLRDAWEERGTTTKKDRQIGWFDAVAVNYAIATAGLTELAATCGDRMELLGKLKEPIRVVTGYKIDGKTYREWEAFMDRRDTLHEAEPMFEEFEPWTEFAVDGKLTDNAARYIDGIQDLVGEISLIGTGKGSEDIIEWKDLLAARGK